MWLQDDTPEQHITRGIGADTIKAAQLRTAARIVKDTAVVAEMIASAEFLEKRVRDAVAFLPPYTPQETG